MEKNSWWKKSALYRTDNQYQLCIHKTVVYETRNRYRRWSVWLSADFADHFVRGSCYLPEVPGSIFFAQERVGKNGKKFKMYKFRSMYMDAEERKAELMKQNRVSDGMMFKLDFDPRVIGNEILPDGTKKTGIGNFIRVTSLDEFPQFFNVLKGDMSIVGTRPPTLDEWNKYELHHRARLAIKPGITGMWQVSGRSEITDFEEVVKLDTEYISEWNVGMDIKLLWKTVVSVIRRDGSM